MFKEKAVASMKKYFAGNERYINHTLKVLAHAETIYNAEVINDSFINNVAILSTIFHDIGIPEAERKYSSPAAEYQEKEGPPIARRLMAGIDVRPDILERVCYIVGYHHTIEKVDGMDFQIIWEADFLVNIEEKNITLEKSSYQKAIEENFKTETGRKLITPLLKDL
ncbi:MAG: HD domain-containing protein [Spirochaetes bacterium]|nr:HD domain-containing protein [Spirochaetota bacterium]